MRRAKVQATDLTCMSCKNSGGKKQRERGAGGGEGGVCERDYSLTCTAIELRHHRGNTNRYTKNEAEQ